MEKFKEKKAIYKQKTLYKMTNNFDLRKFLSENKITKGSKLTEENYPQDIEWEEDGVLDHGGMDNPLELEPEDREDYDVEVVGYSPSTGKFYVGLTGGSYGETRFEDISDIEEMEPQEAEAYKRSLQKRGKLGENFQPKSKLEQVIQAAWAEKDLEKAKKIVYDLITSSRIKSKDQILQTLSTIKNKARFDQYLANSLLKFEKLGLSEEAPSAGLSKAEKSSIVKKAKAGEDLGKKEHGFEKVEKAAEKKYGSKEAGEKVAAAAMWKNATKHEGVNESREAYLTRLVENALGITPVPVAEESNDEMVDENPLPKYKNIDELMKNIESGTNEAAHKYKMNRMKEIADALESKVTSLEEGENAEHIDQKAVKAMKKDIMTLRKGVEKLEKEYEKKFAKKEVKKDLK